MALSDMIISAIIKKGIVWEARNFETDVQIPDSKVTVKIKAEHMTVRIEKDKKDET